MFRWEDGSLAMLCLLVSLSNQPASPFTAQNCNLIVNISASNQSGRDTPSLIGYCLFLSGIFRLLRYALLHHGAVLTDSSAIRSQESSAPPARALFGLRGGFILRLLLLPAPLPLPLPLPLLRARDSLITKSPRGAEKPQTFDKA